MRASPLNGVVFVDLERHPPLAGLPGLADSTAAHFVVRQVYRLHPGLGELRLHQETYEGVRVHDMHALIGIDAATTADGLMSEVPDDGSVSPEEWVQERARDIGPTSRETVFPPQGVEFGARFEERWNAFLKDYIETWTEALVEEVLRRS